MRRVFRVRERNRGQAGRFCALRAAAAGFAAHPTRRRRRRQVADRGPVECRPRQPPCPAPRGSAFTAAAPLVPALALAPALAPALAAAVWRLHPPDCRVAGRVPLHASAKVPPPCVAGPLDAVDHGVVLGPLQAAVASRGLACGGAGPKGPLAVVVVPVCAVHLKERADLVALPPEAPCEPLGVGIRPLFLDQLVEARLQVIPALEPPALGLVLAGALGVLYDHDQLRGHLPGELGPGALAPERPVDLARVVLEAHLLGRSDAVGRAVRVLAHGALEPLEVLARDLGAAARLHRKHDGPLRHKVPQPRHLPVDPPPRLVDVDDAGRAPGSVPEGAEAPAIPA